MTPPDQSPSRPPRSIGVLFAQQVRNLGHRPYLTFYDDATGERTELSYATFDNWACKAANLLAEELDAGSGTEVGVLAPTHWTAAVVIVAAWKLGAVVVLDPRAAPAAGVLFVAEADALAHGEHPGLVVAGAGMGGRVTGTPPGIAFGDEVLAFADDYDDPSVGLDRPALADRSGRLTQGELLRTVEDVAGPSDHLLSTAALTGATAATLLLAPALAGASLVWCPNAEGDLTERMAVERITAILAEDGTVARPSGQPSSGPGP